MHNMRASRDYSELLDELLIDPSEAAAHINAALDDGDDDVLLIALRDVAHAHGFSKIAEITSLNRENLYDALSPKGNPRLSSIEAILKAVGLCLKVEVRQPVA